MPLFTGTTQGGIFADRVRKAGEHRPAPAPQSGTRPQEMRLPRDPVFADATLILPSGKLPAVVTNVNALGARVEFTTNHTLQGDIVLVAPVLGLNSRVRIAWQKGGSAGLVFVKPEQGAGSPLSSARPKINV